MTILVSVSLIANGAQSALIAVDPLHVIYMIQDAQDSIDKSKLEPPHLWTDGKLVEQEEASAPQFGINGNF